MPPSIVVVVTPDGGTQGLGHAEADAHGDTDDEENDEDLGDDAISVAQPGKWCVAAALNFGGLGLLLPVLLGWPHLLLALAAVGTHAVVGRSRVNHLHGLNIRLEGVELVRARVLARAGSLVVRRVVCCCRMGERDLLRDGDG